MTSLYVESLLLEVHLEDSNDLKQEMKSRWPKLDVIEPPPGAELADPNQTTNPKDKRKRPDTVKVTKTIIHGHRVNTVGAIFCNFGLHYIF